MKQFARVLMAGSAVVAMAMPLAAMPVSAVAQVSQGAVAVDALPTLNLSAKGVVKVVPDQATVTFGVVTEAATAREAMQANANRMAEVSASLRRAGLSDRDIQTSGLNLSAQYDYQQNESPKLRGYQANNSVTVVIRDLSKTGTTVDAVVAAGVNQIDGISFGLQDPSVAEDQARRLAVQALQAKANLYAEALGKPLSGLINLSENGGYAPQPMPRMYARAAGMEAQSATAVEAGELSVEINVTGSYSLSR